MPSVGFPAIRRPDQYGDERFELAGNPQVELNEDGSINPIDFLYAPQAQDKTLHIDSVKFFGSNIDIIPGNFLGIDALTNGIRVDALDPNDNVVFDFTGGIPIKTTADFGFLTGDQMIWLDQETGPNKVDLWVGIWHLSTANVVFELPPDFKIRVRVFDDITAIPMFAAQVLSYQAGIL